MNPDRHPFHERSDPANSSRDPDHDHEKPTRETARPNHEPRRRNRRRFVTLAVVLGVAAAIQWRRQVGLWVIERWVAYKAGGQAIRLKEALHLIADQQAVILDVRAREEYAVSHLEGARSYPLQQLKKDGWPKQWPTDRPIICYCTVGYRSGIATRFLEKQGLNARNLQGGILACAQAHQPLVDSHGPTNRVNTWSQDYAWLLPVEYRAVSSESATNVSDQP